MELVAYAIIEKLLLSEWINEHREIIVTNNIIHFRMNTYTQIIHIPSLWMVDCSREIRKWLLLGRKTMTNLDSVLKSKDITLPTNIHIVKAIYGFSCSQVWMWEFDHKEGWAPKNWCFWTTVLEKTLDSPLDSKEIKPVNPKENQPWIFIGRTDAEAEAPVLWSPDGNSQLIGKVPDSGKDWGQNEKAESEDKMARWHYRYNGHELEQTLGHGEGQGGLACCRPWGHKESDTTG